MCVHDMDNCAYHPEAVSFEDAARALVAAMAYPSRAVILPAQTAPVHVYAVPSTDAFEAYRDLDAYVSADPAHRQQLPRLTYPHWAVTTEARAYFDTHVQWSERNTYGETTELGMLPVGHTPAAQASNHRW